ncbi:alkaline phosphatase [Actinocatenispora thailandica]|uniref:Alkaline phosphatase n=1 Tax=Actinocatenispora thailandica TaxID=227318 RepID=A0A7R7DV05_9ACTN|nr:alkaline phosphatase D family protein [Actinocatenispora thailandica]BCJ38350.1 alkaline phosphatase [Actinocatenispora thailandica]
MTKLRSGTRKLSRRALFGGALAAGGTLAVPGLARPGFGAPALVRSGRPALTHGTQVGDIEYGTGTVWTRADRPSRMVVEISADPRFRRVRRLRGPLLTPDSDLTGKTVLHGLPAGRDIHYRVTAVDVRDDTLASEPLIGRFRTVPNRPRDVQFLWSGDLGGQGWGIDVSRGGYRIFDAMRALDPDFYLCNGDNIYADDPIEARVTLPDGSIWRNLVTEEKSKVAETLDEYRGNYKYNLADEPLRRFYAQVAQIQQWDDHETHNNWYPGEILTDDAYTEKRVDVLKYRSQQAWHEYTPITPRYDREDRIYRVLHHGPLLDVFVLDMRWYRDANSADKQTYNDGGILGYEQAAWLKRELARSRATWKVISNDMPLGIVVSDTLEGKQHYEAVSQGDDGKPLGRELQIADLLSFLKREDIRNVVWLTTDVHYTAAHYFDPARAAFTDFNPFWQFVSGPLNAGAFPASPVDQTFGCNQVFVQSPPTANASPATDYQFFGRVQIDAASRELTVHLHNNTGASVWSKTLTPHRR